MSKREEFENADRRTKPEPRRPEPGEPPRPAPPRSPGPIPEPPAATPPPITAPTPPEPGESPRQPLPAVPPPPPPEYPPARPPGEVQPENPRSYWWLVGGVGLSVLIHLWLLWGGQSPTIPQAVDLSPLTAGIQEIKQLILGLPRPRECPPSVQPPRKKWPRPGMRERELARQVSTLQGKLSWVRKLERRARKELRSCKNTLLTYSTKPRKATRPTRPTAQELHYRHREVLQKQFMDGIKCDGYDYILHFKTEVRGE